MVNYNDHQIDELDWQAFRYLANEMTADERTTFEQRLETDLAACEALARGVELTTAIALAEPLLPAQVQRSTTTSTTWRYQLAWVSAGTVALLAMVGFVNFYAPAHHSNEKLAAVWSTTQADWLAEISEEVSQDELETSDQLAAIDLPETPVVPGWMLAAVRGMKESDHNLDDSERKLDSRPFGNEAQEN